MRLHASVWLVILALGYAGCSDDSVNPAAEGQEMAAAKETVTPTEAPAASTPGPEEICGQLVTAAQEENSSKLLALCTPGSSEALASGKAKMAFTKHIAKAVCGDVAVTGDKATVDAKVGDVTRQLPFAKVAGTWKFDTAAYMTKYPPAMPAKPQAVKEEPQKRKRKKNRRRKKRDGKRRRKKQRQAETP